MTERLLPQPKELVHLEGSFSFDASTLILVPSGAADSSFLAARQLQDEVRSARCCQEPRHLEVPIVKAFAPPRASNVVVLACGPEPASAFGLPPVPLDAPYPVQAQAYALAVAPSRITLYAEEQAGLHYAVQTLRQLVRQHGPTLPALGIRDWPTLPSRGLMLDISRRKVAALATLKHVAEQLSHYKLNVLQLYTEHTFQFPRHPKIGAGCGSLSSEDIVELICSVASTRST